MGAAVRPGVPPVFNYEVKAIIQDYKSIERVNAEKQLNYETEVDLKYSGVTKKEIFTAAENKNMVRYKNMSRK